MNGATIDWVRMARQHVESLRAAGIEWIARGAVRVVASPQKEADAPSISTPSLLERPSVASLTVDQKRVALEVLNRDQVAGCTRCPELVCSRKQTVFGVGHPSPELCFVGEAPGADEDVQGEPFVGAAGQLLNRIIEACKMKREDVYICNVLKCRPPGNRTPLPNEIANCRPHLEQQLATLQPRFICALGAVAAQWLTGSNVSIGKLRKRFHDYRGIPVLCTYHPAYLLRNPAAKRDVWDDMKMLMTRMGRPVA